MAEQVPEDATGIVLPSGKGRTFATEEVMPGVFVMKDNPYTTRSDYFAPSGFHYRPARPAAPPEAGPQDKTG